MVEVNVSELRAHWSKYLKKVESGEVVIITRRRQPVAELRSIRIREHLPRPIGLCEGEFVVPDDFDELPDEMLDAFEGS